MSERTTRTLRLNPVLSAMVEEIMLFRGTSQLQQFVETLIRDEWDRRKPEMSADAVAHVMELVRAEREAARKPKRGGSSSTVNAAAEKILKSEVEKASGVPVGKSVGRSTSAKRGGQSKSR